MKKFAFSKDQRAEDAETSTRSLDVFSGSLFYNEYKDATFLRHSDNIETILCKGHELRKMLKEKANPGDLVKMIGMSVTKNYPLYVRNTGPNVTLDNQEFTSNRLTGLVAAYAFDNRHRFPVMKSSEAHSLGLTWDNEDETKCRLFLSAVTGTAHFYEQFHHWPLICALRKLQLNKITLELVLKIANTKNDHGIRMGRELMINYIDAAKLWQHFPGTSKQDLNTYMNKLPVQLKKVLLRKD